MSETAQITPDQFAQLIALLEAKNKKKSAKGTKKGHTPLTDEQKAANRAKVDIQTLANFTAKGYKDVQPRVNVMTYNKWIEAGRRVKKGEKSTICGSFALFHVDQTEQIATQH